MERNAAKMETTSNTEGIRIPERHFGVAEEANLEVAVGRQTQPVARAAKVLRHGRDESDRSPIAWHPERLQAIDRVDRQQQQHQR